MYVSIIIPALNEEENISDCIRSLLSQDFPKDQYEIIVVDNGSTDSTLDILKKLPIRVFEEKKKGPSSARNRGILNAKGEILGFIDADCIADPLWIRRGVEKFHPNIGCVGGKTLIFGSDNNRLVNTLRKLGAVGAKDGPILTYPYPYFPTLNVFFKKDVFEKIGLFDESLITGEDVDICWRMQFLTNYQFGFAPDALVYHRSRNSIYSLFKQRKAYANGRVLLFKKHKTRLPKRNLKEIYWGYVNLFIASGRLIGLSIKKLFKTTSYEIWYESYVRFVILLATKIGHIQGTFKYRHLYL